jgi:hypothetical protein
MSYRLTDPNPVWVGLLGTTSAANGTLQFYDQGTTTPKATYSDEGLTTPNANPVELDAAGRAETEIWLDGPYTVVLKDEDGTTVWTRDVVPEVSPTTSLPDPTTLPGGTVKSNGTGYELVEVPEMPDPTDSAGYQVVVNSTGTGYNLQPIAEPPELTIGITVTSSRAVFTDDEGNKWQILRGTATTSSGSGTYQATRAVEYSNAFSETVVPAITPTGGPFAPGNEISGYFADVSVTASSATGFTVTLNTNHGESNADANISGNITFGFIAVGPIASG